MKTRILRLTSQSALLAMAALTVALFSAAAQAADETRSPAHASKGCGKRWLRQLIAPQAIRVTPPFPGLFTFNRGGTMSEYGISPGMTPALRSPGHGIWRHDGGPNFSFTFTFNRYDASGLFVGTQRITAALVLGGSNNDFTTTSTIEIFDVNGNLIATGCAMATGARFEFE